MAVGVPAMANEHLVDPAVLLLAEERLIVEPSQLAHRGDERSVPVVDVDDEDLGCRDHDVLGECAVEVGSEPGGVHRPEPVGSHAGPHEDPAPEDRGIGPGPEFLDQATDEERVAALNKRMMWSEPKGFSEDILDSLRRIRRKEMEVKVRHYPDTGKQEPRR